MQLFISQGNHPRVSAKIFSHYQAGYKNKNEKVFSFVISLMMAIYFS